MGLGVIYMAQIKEQRRLEQGGYAAPELLGLRGFVQGTGPDTFDKFLLLGLELFGSE